VLFIFPLAYFAPLELTWYRPSQFIGFFCILIFLFWVISPQVNLDPGFLISCNLVLKSFGLLAPCFGGIICGTRGSPIVWWKQGFLWAITSVHQLEPWNALDQSWHYCFLICVAHMDYREAQEFRRVLQRHEESIQCNKSSIFWVTSKVHENEHQCTSQNAIS
jgi:hypothetical protein